MTTVETLDERVERLEAMVLILSFLTFPELATVENMATFYRSAMVRQGANGEGPLAAAQEPIRQVYRAMGVEW